MRDVAILGVGQTRFGELWDRSFREIGIEAGLGALQEAHLTSRDLSALYLGNMASGAFIDQEHIAPLILDYAGLAGHHIPAIRVEAGSASGAMALHQAYLAVASGLHDFVVVGGAEKMTDVPDTLAQAITSATADQEWETVFGATLPALWALMARRHMQDHGTRREDLARLSVLAHAHASKNPLAQFRNPISVEAVLESTPVAEPLGVLDCAPASDGAAAVVLGPLEGARRYTDVPIRIAASEVACDTMALQHRKDITTLEATVVARQKALKRSRREISEIPLVEVHDAYSISGLMALEDLGFYPKGRAAAALRDGEGAIGSRLTVNSSGGLKAQGQPFGAVGIAQVVEVVRQLRGQAAERQVSKATVGMTHNVGGTGATAVVHVLERAN
jgi:acetyl-CoA C-acetyltransferase